MAPSISHSSAPHDSVSRQSSLDPEALDGWRDQSYEIEDQTSVLAIGLGYPLLESSAISALISSVATCL